MKYHLKLTKALSYSGIVNATRKNPDVFTDDESVATAAVNSGYFENIGDRGDSPATDTRSGEQTNEESEPVRHINELNTSELETLAAYYNIVLKGATKKADIIEKIKAALDEATWNNGYVAYGSPTMTELQQE